MGKREVSPAAVSLAGFSHEVMSAYVEPYGVYICAVFLLESLFESSATVFSINILNDFSDYSDNLNIQQNTTSG